MDQASPFRNRTFEAAATEIDDGTLRKLSLNRVDSCSIPWRDWLPTTVCRSFVPRPPRYPQCHGAHLGLSLHHQYMCPPKHDCLFELRHPNLELV